MPIQKELAHRRHPIPRYPKQQIVRCFLVPLDPRHALTVKKRARKPPPTNFKSPVLWEVPRQLENISALAHDSNATFVCLNSHTTRLLPYCDTHCHYVYALNQALPRGQKWTSWRNMK